MDRRSFIASTAAVGAAAPTLPQGGEEFTAGSAPGLIFAGAPVVSGPAHDAITILQPIQRFASGFLEFAVGDGPFQRVDADSAGLLPLEQYVLKFRLPPLPMGVEVKYRVTAHTVGWIRVRTFFHGEVRVSPPQTTETRSFKTLDPAASSTSFVVWNDTHENQATLKALHAKTEALKPDFLLWNGDQSNDYHFEKDMNGQLLSPFGLPISDKRPLAYVRGNHDVRGPEAHRLPKFTGTPGDAFHYAFRSGPVAALVMDTGEDKPDDHRYFGGMAAFQPMQRRQLEWLKQVSKEPWFREAPFKVLFCHIPLYFKREISQAYGSWESHRFCRDLWMPTLVEAGVKLIVSGHTHDAHWMPAKDGQPIAQLVGGGPQPKSATIIHGNATKESLTLTMSRLDGTVVAAATFNA